MGFGILGVFGVWNVWSLDIEAIVAYRSQKTILKIVASVSQAKRAERSGLLLSLVYRKVTCDISKSKNPVANFFEFLDAVKDLRK